MLDICIEYSILYVWKQKHFVQKRKKTKNNKKKTKQKEKHFFLPFAAKRPGVNAASVLDDYLLGKVLYLTWLGV